MYRYECYDEDEYVLTTTILISQIDPKRAIPREDQDKTEKVFVGGIPHEVNEAEFRDFFGQFGLVIDATLMIDKDTGRPRGFGFITFDSAEPAETILMRQDLEMRGKPIEVKRAVQKNKQGRMMQGQGFGGRDMSGMMNYSGGMKGSAGYPMAGMQGMGGAGGAGMMMGGLYYGGNPMWNPAAYQQYYAAMAAYYQNRGMSGGSQMGMMNGMNPMAMGMMPGMMGMPGMSGMNVNQQMGSQSPNGNDENNQGSDQDQDDNHAGGNDHGVNGDPPEGQTNDQDSSHWPTDQGTAGDADGNWQQTSPENARPARRNERRNESADRAFSPRDSRDGREGHDEQDPSAQNYHDRSSSRYSDDYRSGARHGSRTYHRQNRHDDGKVYERGDRSDRPDKHPRERDSGRDTYRRSGRDDGHSRPSRSRSKSQRDSPPYRSGSRRRSASPKDGSRW